jgi:segregation and condensation protein A
MNDSAVQATLDLPIPPAPALARVLGEPLTELPADLYIPPDALEVVLEAFEGPLDLLLYLIRRHNLDVLDIPMADLTRQYMVYVESMRTTRLELAAEYLVMAATLIDIKSRMLLPRPRTVESEESADDPRAELVRRLLEYEQIKLAARGLAAMPQEGRDFHAVSVWVEAAGRRLPEVRVEDLSAAWLAILTRARSNRHHTIHREELSIRAHMSRILKLLRAGEHLPFERIFEPGMGVSVLVVSLLAMLELAKEWLIELTQTEPFAPIYLSLAREHADAE